MNYEIEILNKIKEKIGIIVLTGLVFATFSFLFILISQEKYQANTELLIIQNATESKDFYTLSKSAEYFGRILGETLYSELFISEVAKSGKVKDLQLGTSGKEKMETWKKTVKIDRNAELGIIGITVFNNTQIGAADVSQGIIDTIVNKNNLFRGEGNFSIKVLSGPIVEKNPGVVSVMAVMTGGFVMGCVLSLIWVFYFGKSPVENFSQARQDFSAEQTIKFEEETIDKTEKPSNYAVSDEWIQKLRELNAQNR